MPEKCIPMCWKCASATMTPSETEGALTLGSCIDNPDIKCYEDAETMCPWLEADAKAEDDGCVAMQMVSVPMDFPKDLFLELYERGIRELSKERVVAAYCEWKLPEMMGWLNEQAERIQDEETSSGHETGET